MKQLSKLLCWPHGLLVLHGLLPWQARSRTTFVKISLLLSSSKLFPYHSLKTEKATHYHGDQKALLSIAEKQQSSALFSSRWVVAAHKLKKNSSAKLQKFGVLKLTLCKFLGSSSNIPSQQTLAVNASIKVIHFAAP